MQKCWQFYEIWKYSLLEYEYILVYLEYPKWD